MVVRARILNWVWPRPYLLIAVAGAALVAGGGMTLLLGAATLNQLLATWHPEGTRVSNLSALGLLFAGLGLWAASFPRGRLVRPLACLVVGIGATRALLGIFGIEALPFAVQGFLLGNVTALQPMFTGAFSLCLLGLGLYGIAGPVYTPRRLSLVATAGTLVFGIGALTFVGFVSKSGDASTLAGWELWLSGPLPLSLILMAAGSGLNALAWHRSIEQLGRHPSASALRIALLMLFGSLSVWQVVADSHEDQIHLLTTIELEAVKGSIDRELFRRDAAFAETARDVFSTVPSELATLLSTHLMTVSPKTWSFLAVIEKSTSPATVVPAELGNTIQGWMTLPVVQAWLENLRRDKTLLYGPVVTGYDGHRAQLIGKATQDADGRALILLGDLRVQALLQSTPMVATEHFRVTLEQFSGSALPLQAPDVAQMPFSASTMLHRAGMRLRLSVVPTPELLATWQNDFLVWLLFLICWLVPMAFGAMVYLAQAARRRTGELALANSWLELEVLERTKAESAVKIADERLNLALRSGRVGTYTWDLLSGKIVLDHLLKELLGLSDTQAVDNVASFLDLIHSDDRERIRAEMGDAQVNSIDYETEFRVVRTSGEIHSLLTRGAVHRDKAGTALRVTGTCHDVTELKEAQEAIFIASERLSLATSVARMGVWDYDVPDNRLTWDDLMYTIYGISKSEFLGAYEAWEAGLHPEDKERAAAELQSALRGEKEFKTEFRVVWPDGSIRYVEAYAVVLRDSAGAPRRMIGTNRDITAERLAEAKSRTAEERLRAILDNSSTVIYLKDLEGRYLVVNESFRRLLQLDDDAILGKTVFDLWPRAMAKSFCENDLKVVKTEQTWEIEEEIVDQNKRRLYISIKFPVRDMYGKIYAVGAVSTDITERKRAELELAASETRLRVLFEGVDDTLFVHDLQGRLLDCNPAACTRLGYTREELLTLSIADTDAPGFAEGFEERLALQLTQGRLECDGMHRRKDGQLIPVHVTTTLIDYAGAPAVLALAHDLSERQRLQQRFEKVVEASPYAVILVDGQGQITMVNSECEEMFGYSRKELLNHHIEMLIPTKSRETHHGNLRSFFANPTTRAMKSGRSLIALRRGGIEFHVEIDLAPIQTAEGVLVLASVNDISARIGAENSIRVTTEKLEALNIELTRANEELNQFAYVASHDLQEPLRTVITYAGFLREDLGATISDEVSEDLAMMEGAARRMRNLVQDLLEFSRSARRELRRENFALKSCVEAALLNLESKITETGAEIVVHALPEVFADNLLLVQVYQNLISNALKFRTSVRPRVEITAAKERGIWVFGVLDNGIGIAPEYKQQIFAPFKRLHGTHEFEGTGIGLAICRTAVERHGGRIWVESEPGQGCHFRFTLEHEVGSRNEDDDQ